MTIFVLISFWIEPWDDVTGDISSIEVFDSLQKAIDVREQKINQLITQYPNRKPIRDDNTVYYDVGYFNLNNEWHPCMVGEWKWIIKEIQVNEITNLKDVFDEQLLIK